MRLSLKKYSYVLYENKLNVDDWRIDDVLRYSIVADHNGNIHAGLFYSVFRYANDKAYRKFIRELFHKIY